MCNDQRSEKDEANTDDSLADATAKALRDNDLLPTPRPFGVLPGTCRTRFPTAIPRKQHIVRPVPMFVRRAIITYSRTTLNDTSWTR